MNIEPDTIILHRFYPWVGRSRFRMATFGTLFVILLAIMIYYWLAHFFSPLIFGITLLGLLLIFLVLFSEPPSQTSTGQGQLAPNFCPDCGAPQFETRFCPHCGRRHF
ncbi:MAG: hypothetical protein JSW28_06635 [Thermoplasmata archaeon]|nr:MAG: hypothetical protein JSW28_06635 [Thermoplasmata archaeon]